MQSPIDPETIGSETIDRLPARLGISPRRTIAAAGGINILHASPAERGLAPVAW